MVKRTILMLMVEYEKSIEWLDYIDTMLEKNKLVECGMH